ncbi:MAG: hypothetical protein UU54_C0007G0001, partial [Candidatus Yanofskybacteria bacterium GW2011_GWA2_41_22]
VGAVFVEATGTAIGFGCVNELVGFKLVLADSAWAKTLILPKIRPIANTDAVNKNKIFFIYFYYTLL